MKEFPWAPTLKTHVPWDNHNASAWSPLQTVPSHSLDDQESPDVGRRGLRGFPDAAANSKAMPKSSPRAAGSLAPRRPIRRAHEEFGSDSGSATAEDFQNGDAELPKRLPTGIFLGGLDFLAREVQDLRCDRRPAAKSHNIGQSSTSYHSIRVTKRFGLLRDPGASSGIIGTDAAREYQQG
eukprot:540953-Pyramimonas_sp.AAC.1